MRAIRQSGSEGGAAGVTTGRPYPYTATLAQCVTTTRRSESETG